MKKDILKEALAEANLVKEMAVEAAKQQLSSVINEKVNRMVTKSIMEDEDVSVATEPEEDEVTTEADEIDSDEDEITEEDAIEADEDDLQESDDADEDDVELAEDQATEDGEGEPETDLEEDITGATEDFDSDVTDAEVAQNDEMTEDDVTGLEDDSIHEDDMESAVEDDETEMLEVDGIEDAGSEEDEITLEDELSDLEDETPAVEALRKENADLKKKLKVFENSVKYLTNQFKAVNLLNTKLMYSGKIFNSYKLSENMKKRVINMLDRANSLREAKLVFVTLTESLKRVQSLKSISENRTASKTVTTVKPKAVLTESEKYVKRMQALANIK